MGRTKSRPSSSSRSSNKQGQHTRSQRSLVFLLQYSLANYAGLFVRDLGQMSICLFLDFVCVIGMSAQFCLGYEGGVKGNKLCRATISKTKEQRKEGFFFLFLSRCPACTQTKVKEPKRTNSSWWAHTLLFFFNCTLRRCLDIDEKRYGCHNPTAQCNPIMYTSQCFFRFCALSSRMAGYSKVNSH